MPDTAELVNGLIPVQISPDSGQRSRLCHVLRRERRMCRRFVGEIVDHFPAIFDQDNPNQWAIGVNHQRGVSSDMSLRYECIPRSGEPAWYLAISVDQGVG